MQAVTKRVKLIRDVVREVTGSFCIDERNMVLVVFMLVPLSSLSLCCYIFVAAALLLLSCLLFLPCLLLLFGL